MKHTRLVTLTLVTFSIILLAAFAKPSQTAVDKNIVFRVSYDAAMNKLVASEKLEVSSNLIQRTAEGKILAVNKDAILSEMPMATKMITQSMVGSNATEMYALVTFHISEKTAGDVPTDEKMLDYFKISHDSYTQHNFPGSEYTISGKNWSCAGPSCGFNIPAGIEVYVWQ